MSEEPTCPICGKTREEHLQLEAQRILNHQFTADGSLLPVDRSPKGKSDRRREVMVVPGADVTLRAALIRKGILDEADLADLGAIGAVSQGDCRDRTLETSSGSLRHPPGESSAHPIGSHDAGSGIAEPEHEAPDVVQDERFGHRAGDEE